MPALPSRPTTRALLAVTALALGLYAAFKKGRGSDLIDTPETIARRVDAEEDDKDEPEFDVVILGGGTAGCVIASRISENPNIRVLLLEAGGSSHWIRESQIPAIYSQIIHTTNDYDLWTEPQVNAHGERKYWPRGKMLGGCSGINAMMFHTCAPSDYDEWADSNQEGAAGWSHKQFLPYFLKFEKFVPHPSFPDVDPSVRGANGPVRVGFFGHFTEATSKWIKSHVNLGIPLNPDVNTPEGTLGVTKVLTYINSRGRRVNTENAYLTPEVLKRPNLKVAVHSHVTRILFDTHAGKKRAVGVEFARKKDGPRYRVRVKQEVVVSAGAIHSPHILMLSGVGPKEHLVEYGIPVTHDLPGVGQRLQDHATVDICLRTKASNSFLSGRNIKESIQAFAALVQWQLFGTGPLTSNVGEGAGFMRLDDTKLFPPDSYKITDESSGPDAPDLETIIVPFGYKAHGHGVVSPGSTITSLAILLRPQSWGTITLKSANPFDAPCIDPRYLSSKNDLAGLVRGLKLSLQVARTEPLASYLVHDDDPTLDHNLHLLSDAELETEVRKRIETLYHPTSTCRMAPLEDGGVVDPYLRVYGIENLRVADASIFPRIPSGHTSAPSIAVGEKAADMIKESLDKVSLRSVFVGKK